METRFEALRARFPLLARKTYLNSGSYGALAIEVEAAVQAYLRDRNEAGADWELWVGKHEAVRQGLAVLLGVAADEIAVTASASAGLNALASALDFTGGRDTVVTTDFEFPTSAQIWHAQAPRGARVVHAHPRQDGYIPLEAFEALIDERTRIVAATQVCYRNGAKLDVAGLARLAHARGALMLLDCYQTVGSEPIDLKALGVDFAIGGMMKYLIGTAGIGFLYARAELIPGLVPTASGWFAQADIGAMDITANHPSPTARRFEAGTPAVVNAYAAEAGLKIISDLGTQAIGDRVRCLTRLLLDRLQAIGWPAITPDLDARRGPLVAVPSRDAAGLCAELARQGIVTSHRDGNVRAGVHAYNNEDDIETLIAALEAARGGFR
ncbi:aminotransferase class V-fold PLP-dependent enzyme [Phenylobacterium montanum]|uniref:Aminotransferase class V-fold PLP-dependent enzyme n=1 Tax=Phenylobacterium montanum TaxID=2823693 RepID=A0A975G2M8_9CAUL|nr:aminotransferase class V-fold PLP-dependent enzyme [Caulobacter sp. S6]QUD89422.1 aminotransferase class V-fold PLP-dependent enzyme [Caulobacter sp. S6]